MSRAASAELLEIFQTIQGEGIYVGLPQIFVRFGLCNMKCRYCDTPGLDEGIATPIEEIQRDVTHLAQQTSIRSVSLTGGEPLLHVAFLKRFMPWLKQQGLETYLETNGTFPSQLQEVLAWTDIIAMDIKPPSATHDRPYWKEHREFLEIGKAKDLFVKIVVTRDTQEDEIQCAIELIASMDPAIPLVLQPVTPYGDVTESVSLEQLLAWSAQAARRLRDVRVIPQVHKLMGIP